MKKSSIHNSADHNSELQSAKESKTITQSPNNSSSLYPRYTAVKQTTELIRKAQNGDTEALLTLLIAFEPLLEREAGRYLAQNLFQEKEDAKSQVIVDFCEFVTAFHNYEAENGKIAGLIKKYLHDCRIDFGKAAARHCPDCYTVDFEKELEENSPFSQSFPCYEMQAERKLDREFLMNALLESMVILTRKEETVVKKIIIENKPPSSVAAELHCSTRYIRKVKHGALTKMRRYLETHYPCLKAL